MLLYLFKINIPCIYIKCAKSVYSVFYHLFHLAYCCFNIFFCYPIEVNSFYSQNLKDIFPVYLHNNWSNCQCMSNLRAYNCTIVKNTNSNHNLNSSIMLTYLVCNEYSKSVLRTNFQINITRLTLVCARTIWYNDFEQRRSVILMIFYIILCGYNMVIELLLCENVLCRNLKDRSTILMYLILFDKVATRSIRQYMQLYQYANLKYLYLHIKKLDMHVMLRSIYLWGMGILGKIQLKSIIV
ncbi:hypothetical protein AGLY_009179 [Aphis glycines]|uniref:Uncharacterized protein n=1 Tax=Aphis glycines TaxID=307491 RepID=A0A6G0TJ60_APHGL|nr:hypothetical protein AGLY_009179 [Aphis glycines]